MPDDATGTGNGRTAARVRIGPFSAGDITFVVDTADLELGARIDDDLRDLRGGSVTDATWVYETERSGPRWLPNSWTVRRNGEIHGTELTRDHIPLVVVHDVTARITPPGGVASVAGSVISRHGHALVLIVAADAARTDWPAAWSSSDLVAALLEREWALVSHDRAPLRISDGGELVVAEPFWRPFEVTAAMVERHSIAGRKLLPISMVGALSAAAPVGAVVVIEPAATTAAAGPGVRPIAPAATLRDLATQLVAPEGSGRAAFLLLASVVEKLPAFRVTVDPAAIEQACDAIGGLVEAAAA